MFLIFLRLRLTQKALQLTVLLLSVLFFLLVAAFGRTVKKFLGNVSRSIIQACCQDRTYSIRRT